MMSASCEGVLMKNLEACMQQVATLVMTIGAPCNTDLPLVEGCTTTPLTSKGLPLYFHETAKKQHLLKAS